MESHHIASPPTAVQDGPTSIRVSWTPSSDATGYMIHYTSSRGDSGSEDVSRGHSDSYTLTGLVKEDTYTISIRATSQVFSSSPITVEVTLSEEDPLINPRRACAARVTVVVLCVCVCVQAAHLRLTQLSDKLDILTDLVSWWLQNEFVVFRIMA